MSIVIRDDTRNQATFDLTLKTLLIRNNSFLKGDYENISGAEETVVVGQVLGRVAATQKLVVCKSAAVDGSEVPVAIAVQELTAIAIAGTVDNIAPCNDGKVNENVIVFNGADTFATLVGGISMRDHLIANTKGLEFVNVLPNTDFDN
ncbi:head decoration protein [Candidatus Pacearchaeota archaeon]|nr:head decoration protein [Candidatus Pacearchaeota archaeon]